MRGDEIAAYLAVDVDVLVVEDGIAAARQGDTGGGRVPGVSLYLRHHGSHHGIEVEFLV
jgi:hypothetical protein